jgi:hypothetical protein
MKAGQEGMETEIGTIRGKLDDEQQEMETEMDSVTSD